MHDCLFVCTGNTCRSPMAEVVYNKLCPNGNAVSAGLSVFESSGANPFSKEAVKKFGLNLDGHKSRQISFDDIENSKLIITMTKAQKDMICSVVPGKESKIITLAEFAGKTEDIADPFGLDLQFYEKTADMIYDYIKKGLSKRSIYTYIATQDDLSDIFQLETETFTDAWSENSIKNEIEKGSVLVAKRGGNLVGYCIFMKSADEGEIYKIAVDRSVQRQGIGSIILEKTISHLKELGAENIYLEVRKSNEKAINLYEKFGFLKLGERKNYYPDNSEDALLFSLKRND